MFKINPCRSCLDKYKDSGCDVNHINKCCYEIAAAFSGWDSINAISGTEMAENCKQCVDKVIRDIGKTPCTLQISQPPIWNQVPHYFPDILYKNKEKGTPTDPVKLVKDSFQECIQMCSSDSSCSSEYPNECKSNCLTDANAIEIHEPYKPPSGKSASPSPATKVVDSTVGVIVRLVLLILIGIVVVGLLIYFIIYKTKPSQN